MTDNIITIAKETGILTEYNYREIINFGYALSIASRSIEREECAKVCENAPWFLDDREEYARLIREKDISIAT